MELDLKPIELPGIEKKRPMIIAGPCSAETEEQVMDTAWPIKALRFSVPASGNRVPNREVSKASV